MVAFGRKSNDEKFGEENDEDRSLQGHRGDHSGVPVAMLISELQVRQLAAKNLKNGAAECQ